ncbi:MAG: virulence factor [Planctomycetes bacterium]|nr:virulence factor [Planctomycetota bacterium]
MPIRIQVLCWKNIPTQVKAADDSGAEHDVPLSERFQQAVDALAMKQELAGTDEYLELWAWSDVEDGAAAANAASPQAAAEAHAQALETGWPKQVPAMVGKAEAEAPE